MHGTELPAKAADAIERVFVRLFAPLAAVSWIGMVLAELRWFPRIGLVDVGGFDPVYQRAAAEDRELCDRWTRLGRRLIYVPGARVSHAHPLTLRMFWRQHYTYGRGAWGVRQSKALHGAGGVHSEPLTFYWGLITHPLRHRGASGARLSARLFLPQIANAIGFASEAFRATWMQSRAVRHI